ncbi:hypothetical protein K5V21_16085 [Clostridium sardiniense]|uniref:Uncharacterized protein n=1 Tax=Clostridium sardiniense TaxID=29369 RepID=A0ABS7L1L8_CLOSR|nr:hypothetical protein [Clostridium sardiniense]MBY0756941.1 hypothetical protein [Clostridium sardiniense]MBY0756965.1 hypothetical protein [Clostridium sardiniense]MDQ0460359.1 hypothetical protein [Clostridium sardiniense]
MFCSVKKDRKNNIYRFYICDRYRDKETKKVKSSDKYIMSLQANEILNLSIENLKVTIEDNCINKGINLDNIDLVMEKINALKDVVTTENTTTKNNNYDVVVTENITTKNDFNNVVIQEYDTTNKSDDIEVVEAEIVEEFTPSYKTTISFDVQQEYSKNVKRSLGFNSMITAFGGSPKNTFEIEEEELSKIHDKADNIKKSIEEIIKEYEYVENLNSELKDLNSDISIVQDIYISCYDKVPSSEIWLIGNGYIEKIYRIKDIILPYQGSKLYECWEEIKEEYNLDDGKTYINQDEYFKEIDLYNQCTFEFNKDDITGTLVKIMLSGNCEVDYTMSDFIDINFSGNSPYLSIDHLIDWINDEPIKDYKVDIDSLLQYKEQLHKYKSVER